MHYALIYTGFIKTFSTLMTYLLRFKTKFPYLFFEQMPSYFLISLNMDFSLIKSGYIGIGLTRWVKYLNSNANNVILQT